MPDDLPSSPLTCPAADTGFRFREGADVIKEFRDFILRGNLVDLAVAVVIGTAFAALVKSLPTT